MVSTTEQPQVNKTKTLKSGIQVYYYCDFISNK